MFDAFVIEAGGATAGIVVRDDRGFRFYASSYDFSALEGRRYRRPADAQRAARALVATRRDAALKRAA